MLAGWIWIGLEIAAAAASHSQYLIEMLLAALQPDVFWILPFAAEKIKDKFLKYSYYL